MATLTSPVSGYSSTARKTLILGADGATQATAANPLPVDAVVSVDSMSLTAEMKVNTGHDLYKTTTNVGDGISKVTFDSVAGLALEDVQAFENKTQGWIYNTKGATVTNTTITLDLTAQNTGYPVPGVADEFEIIYRGVSRLTDGTQISQAVGNVAHDAVDSGAPVKMGGVARTTQMTAVAQDDRVNQALTKSGEIIAAVYDYSTQANRVSEIDPVSGHHMSETLANITDGSDDVYYYYFDMDGYRYFTLQGAISSGNGAVGTETITATVEISIQDDGTAPSSCTYIDATSEIFGVANWQDTGGGGTTENFIAVLDEPVAVKYVRLKIDTSSAACGDLADWTIFMKKMF